MHIGYVGYSPAQLELRPGEMLFFPFAPIYMEKAEPGCRAAPRRESLAVSRILFAPSANLLSLGTTACIIDVPADCYGPSVGARGGIRNLASSYNVFVSTISLINISLVAVEVRFGGKYVNLSGSLIRFTPEHQAGIVIKGAAACCSYCSRSCNN